MFNLASWRNLKAITISFLGLLLTFVGDMLDGSMAVLIVMAQTETDTGLQPNVLTDFHRLGMELSTADLYKRM